MDTSTLNTQSLFGNAAAKRLPGSQNAGFANNFKSSNPARFADNPVESA